MRKVFLFWAIVLVILIAGITAFIYGKALLKTEEEKAKRLRRELALPRGPAIPEPPGAIMPEEMPLKIKPPERVPSLDIESLKAPESKTLPPVPEGEVIPILPPQIPEIPSLPEVPKLPVPPGT